MSIARNLSRLAALLNGDGQVTVAGLSTGAPTWDANSNVGVGVALSSWDATYKAIQVGARSMFFGIGSETNIANNVYYNAGNKYVANSAAGLYRIDANVHKWYQAGSGTAGNAITFTQAMTLDASSDLTLVGSLKLGNGNQTVSAANTNDLQLNASNGSGNILFRAAGSERARIDSGGRLLVGSSSSIGSCNAQFNDAGGQAALFNSSSASGSYVGWFNSGAAKGYIGSAAQLTGGSANDFTIRGENNLIFATSSFERARLDSNGFFYVGASNPVSATLSSRRASGGQAFYAGQVVATNDATAIIEQTVGGGNGSQNIGLVVRIQAWNSGDRILNCQYYNNGSPQDKMYVQRDGSSYNATGVWGTISDARVKQDITDASPQWEDFKKIKFRKYRLIDDVEAMADAAPYLMGPVAQELEEAGMNGLVETPTQVDGTELNKQVKLSIMYMKGMKALQEAMLRIEEQQAIIEGLTSRVGALESA